ncbi:glycoside hydrolase family 78 protein [Pseudocercospora fijiensis CIRAD86]|uniref:alpha-L-rhamnosidase n=1 Tax=Pseudocercospora fijiensis (strain CIRAD86) TaxID=383855 RepID=M3AJ97_PSEFD|nr:glycoside hydrolase family 78 protein [Pseudocercospora fijiensis CIRAD86]EME84661.1 glycoside hydrolase family 78 protein [Pseudocercospora fijiensis CIRAD86]
MVINDRSEGIEQGEVSQGDGDGDVLGPRRWTSYGHRLLYQTFDVTSNLSTSEDSRLEVTVAEGWFCGRLGWGKGSRDCYGSKMGLLANLRMEYEDGSSETITTDESWTYGYGNLVASGIYDGETCDLQESSTQNEEVVCLDPPVNVLRSPDSPPVRRTGELKVQQIITTPSGKQVLDFGQNFVGVVRVKVNGPKGTAITFRHAEVLERGEMCIRTLRYAVAIDTLILDGSDAVEWEPKFTFHGFRYVEVTGWPGPIDANDIVGVVLNTDMERTGHFESSNALLNRLHENVVWSMKGNFLSIPTDCPQRDERLGWTGDIAMFGDTANFLYETSGMLGSWLRDVSYEQMDRHGLVPLTVPFIIKRGDEEAHAVWGDVAVILPWSLYRYSGDAEILKRQYESMKAWLDVIPRKANRLWNYKSPWKLGDWLDPAAPPDNPGNATTDPNFVSDVFLLHVIETMVQACCALEKQSEANVYADEAVVVRTAIKNEYVTPSGRLSPDTQTAYVLALHFGLLNEEHEISRGSSRLEELVRRNSHFKIATGFAGTPFVGHAMSKVGLENLFYRMLLHRKCPSWLYPVTMGATTIWERWDSMLPNGDINPGQMTSFNHYALGAVADWMHTNILGLRPASPGWQNVIVEPKPGGNLAWARGSYKTRCGVLKVTWKVSKDENTDGKVLELKVVVPGNTTAEVRLPHAGPIHKVGSGKHFWSVPYVPDPWPPKAWLPRDMDPNSEELPEDEALPFPGWD